MQLADLNLETIFKHIREHGFESLDPDAQAQANEVLQDHVARERFERVAAEPRYWKQSGDRLLAAANLIRTTHLTKWGLSVDDALSGKFDAAAESLKSDMHSVYLFLAGLGVENYAKGAIMTAAAKNHVQGGKIKGLISHDCLELSKRAKVSLTTSEEVTLNCLSASITWCGRYPISNRYDGPKARATHSRIPEDYTNIDEIVKKLLAILDR
jgi:hypothetical protein